MYNCERKIPNKYSNINLGKFGTFSSNQILGRPYYLTFELLDKDDAKAKPELRVVPATELHAEALGSDHATPAETRDENAPTDGAFEYDIVGDDGEVIMRNNRLTIDDPSRQTLSMEEIEELKKAGAGSGKEIITKIMASHMALEEKTSFSLAKYTLRKSRKYLKRFTVLPLDIGTLIDYIADKEAYRIMELREETLGLICSWANVHSGTADRITTDEDGTTQVGGGRWLVVDESGGLVTAALAEKMGKLYPPAEDDDDSAEEESGDAVQVPALDVGGTRPSEAQNGATLSAAHPEQNGTEDIAMAEAEVSQSASQNGATTEQPATPIQTAPRVPRKPRQHIPQMSAQSNTLTVLHSNNQPNLSHLKYFGYDINNPPTSHPLYKHLKSVSWLQLLFPTEDPSYIKPEELSEEALASLKSSKRGTYYKKQRRWERVKSVVDETRRGGFDGLVVASSMEPKTILKEVVPLVRGGGRVVVYSPNVEPLVKLCDFYSKERRTAYIERQFGPQPNGKRIKQEDNEYELNGNGVRDDDDESGLNSTADGEEEEEDFPVNPTLLLAPSLQTARARHWQVLPGRTHPFMTSKGGAEGYLFTATRVLPIEGKVEARGHGRGKKRKTGPDTSAQS